MKKTMEKTMKKTMKNIVCVVLTFIMLTTLFAGCSKGDTKTDTNSDLENSSYVDTSSSTETETQKVYKYESVPLQNVVDVHIFYSDDDNAYWISSLDVICPQCGDEFTNSFPEIVVDSEEMGKNIVNWRGEAWCSEKHGEYGLPYNFPISIQCVLVDE